MQPADRAIASVKLPHTIRSAYSARLTWDACRRSAPCAKIASISPSGASSISPGENGQSSMASILPGSLLVHAGSGTAPRQRRAKQTAAAVLNPDDDRAAARSVRHAGDLVG
jgi:hypothetical protein